MCHHENNIITELLHLCDIFTAASYIRNIFETVVGCEHLHIHVWHKGGIFLCDTCNLIISTFKLFHVLSEKWNFLFTGCDSGFGHKLAKRLDEKGFQVFAGCLAPDREGARQLQETCSKNLTIVQLDVTDDWQVRGMIKAVKEKMNGNGKCYIYHITMSDIWPFQHPV